MLLWCLIWCLSCLHSYHDISLLKVHVSILLDTSLTAVLIATQYLLTLAFSIKVFWVFLDTSRHIAPIHRAKFLNSLFAWHLPRYIKTFSHQHLFDTSRYIKLLFLTPPWYLLDLSRCLFYIYMRVNLVFLKLKHLDTSLFSFHPILILSPKTFISSSFRHFSSSNLLVSGLNPFFSSSFTHFIHFWPRHLNFFGKFGVFVFLLKFLGKCRHCILYLLRLGPLFPNDAEILRPKVD